MFEIYHGKRTVKKPLSNGKGVEVSKQIVKLNNITLFEICSDDYALTHQETTEKSLEFISKLRLALSKVDIPIIFRQGEF